jgi:hypothetical protein
VILLTLQEQLRVVFNQLALLGCLERADKRLNYVCRMYQSIYSKGKAPSASEARNSQLT